MVSVSGVSAQQKGDVYASGSLGFGVTSVVVEGDSATAAEFAIEPSVGYFVADKFMVGFEYQPTERIGLTASMLSLDYVMLSKDGLTLNTVDFGLTFSPSVGFKYYF